MTLLVDEKVIEIAEEKVAAPHFPGVATGREAKRRQEAANESALYRYERKFLVSDLTRREIEALIKLHPAMFSGLYHERFVNNIYLDTVTLENFYATIDGLRHRKKYRIRWYGDLFGEIDQPILEIKSKDGTVGKKQPFPLAAFALDRDFHFGTMIDVFKNSDLPVALRIELVSLQPTLLNRYRRNYFQSADRHYRLTVDSDMEYYLIKARSNTFLQKQIDRQNVIVELKYGNEKDQDADSISSYFPFRVTKSSKYINGIQLLYSW